MKPRQTNKQTNKQTSIAYYISRWGSKRKLITLSIIGFSPLFIPALTQAAIIDTSTITGNELVLTEDSSLAQSSLPTIPADSTFTIKGNYTLQIGPSDAWAMVDTYSNAKLFVEGSLKLVADNQNPASGGFHTNSNSLVDIGGSLDITGSFQYGGSAIELVGNRNQTTEKPSKLIVGKSINIIDATFSGSGPEIIELQNSDIETKAINIINIDRKSTGNGPFTLLGLFGNSSKVSAETLTINTVDSDTGFTAIKLDYPDSKLTVDKIVINNLNGKKGSYLNVSSGITSSGSIKSNAIAISNLTATSDDLFGTQIFGLIDQDDGQVYLATLNTDSIEIQKLIGKEKSAVGFSADLATINTKQLIVNNIQTKLDAIGIDLSNLGDQTSLGQITITDVSGGASAVGLQADNVKISNGIKIQQIQGPEGNSAAIFAKPVSETDTGVVITAKPNANNVIDGDLITGFYEHPDTQEITIGKINAEFVAKNLGFFRV